MNLRRLIVRLDPGWDAARRLVEFGFVDREFVEAQAATPIPDELSAVQAVLAAGREADWSLHPLLEADFATGTWVKHWRRSGMRNRFGAMVDQLVDPAVAEPTCPAFDPKVWMARHPEAATYRGGPLSHFVRTATRDTVMPVSDRYVGTPITWGEFRDESLRRAREFGRQVARIGIRTTNRWVARDHVDWLKQWTNAPVPTFEGRPAVSIIMPVRNRPVVVLEAFRSVQNQTLSDWELIVVDDGSTDSTPEVLREQAALDPRVRVIERPVSGGASAARGEALDAARGHYVAFLDSDDTWEPSFLRLAVAAMHGQGLRAAHAVAEVVSANEHAYLAFEGDFDDLMIYNHINMNVLVAEIELLRDVGGFDPTFRRWIDHDVALRLARATPLTLLPFIGSRHDDSDLIADRITLTESDNWQFAALGKNLVDWTAVRAGLSARIPGRVSMLMPTYQDIEMTYAAVRAVLENAAGADIEVIVVDNGSRRSVSAVLWSMFAGEPRVTVHRNARNYNFSGGSNTAFAMSTGEHVVFLNNDTVVWPGWLAPLLAPLAKPEVLGTQPLLLYGDGTVQSAGSVFLVDGQVASAFLAGHPPEDARRDPGTGFEVVTAAALAMRPADVVELQGFDSIYANGMEDVDLCLRAGRRWPGGSFEVVHASVVSHMESRSPGRGTNIVENRRLFLERWRDSLRSGAAGRQRYAALGFEVASVSGGVVGSPAPTPVLRRSGSAFQARTVDELPHSLRWAINIAALGGPEGEQWGDVHFANALADALRRLGQEPVILRHDGARHPVRNLCDVSLTIRGLDYVPPQPGAVNVLWVISHPDLVDQHEVAENDIVAAASQPWARRMSTRSGRSVQTVLQATEPERFFPAGDDSTNYEALFVGGRPQRRDRPVVQGALEAGADLAVYGPGWQGRLPDGVVRGDYLPNDELPEAYRRAEVVLNDHWVDMSAEGFINNRLFDAVASGACVVSDHVDGIEDLFGGAVRVFHDVDDLRRLLGSERKSAFPDRAERLRIAERIRAEHSFDARARQLHDLVTAEWRARLGS